MNNTVLVTGGAGYIGSHACKALAMAGYTPVSFDNLFYGHEWAAKWGPLIEADLMDGPALAEAFARYQPRAVLHFAAYAYVGESVTNPEKYYQNNVAGTLSLLAAMRQAKCKKIVFSSTCATYGIPTNLPIEESCPQSPINPYGWSKLMIEQILRDFAAAYGIQYFSLRYFNASGADPETQIGEEHDPETHLIPLAIEATLGQRPALKIFGTDYDTPDGTCIRDYIHVTDLAEAHVLALKAMEQGKASNMLNLGTGNGVSVREILQAIAKIAGRKVPALEAGRRPGDPPALFADPKAAKKILNWQPKHSDLDSLVFTAWRWHEKKLFAPESL